MLTVARRRGGRRSNQQNNLRRIMYGTTRAMPFETVLSHHVLSTATAGVNINNLSVTDLIAGDLTGRLVKIVSCRVRLHPYNQATTSTVNYSGQLLYVDQNTPEAVPLTSVFPLSATNGITLNGVFPLQPTWYPTSSTNLTLQIRIWSETVLTAGIIADITTRWMIAQDEL